MIVHHYYPLGSDNIGDHLVARAIREAVTRHFGPADFVHLPVNDRYRGSDRPIGLRGENLDRTNAEADLVIVGGSNLLEARKLPKRWSSDTPAWQWGVFTDPESIRRITPPLLLIGMGTGSSFGQPIRSYAPETAEEIRLLHRQAFAAVVRDATTRQRLGQIGIDVDCTGCPVTFLTDRPVTTSRDDLPLIVSFPPSRIVRRLAGRIFMRGAMRYIAWLRQLGVPLIVTLHETRDLECARQWVPSGTDTFYTEDLDELIARYEECRGVIGFRLHAALLALGLGKPIVPVGVDWRGLAFIETFQLGDLAIRPLRLGQFQKLRRLTNLLLAGDEDLVGRLDRAKSLFRRRYETFLSNATTCFNALVPSR
jgi:hypothetical protein